MYLNKNIKKIIIEKIYSKIRPKQVILLGVILMELQQKKVILI